MFQQHSTREVIQPWEKKYKISGHTISNNNNNGKKTTSTKTTE